MSNLFWFVFVSFLLLDLMIMGLRACLANARISVLVKLGKKTTKIVNRTMALLEKSHTTQSQRAASVVIHFMLAVLVIWSGLVLLPGLFENPILRILAILVFAAIILILESIVVGLVQRDYETWAIRLTPLGEMLNFLFYPFAMIMKVFHRHEIDVERKLGTVTEDELKTWVEAGQVEGTLEQEERKMIYSIFHFSDTLCREVMIPRIDVFALEANISLSEAVQAAVDSGHSRVPVYEDDIDNIIGLLYTKDLLRPTLAGRDSATIRELLRPAYFVPEAKKVDELLREMQAKGVHISVVVDEYGGMAGLVTLEDIVEEIVGDIRDEYDEREELLFQNIGVDEYIFHGRIDIEDFNDILGTDLTRDVADTLGGFIYGEVGRIPLEGEMVEAEDWLLVVERV
ncbi:MAG: hemolysin family protein, partial [Anaerolineaceae bacterium]|nr:hemolysin family protein [Anaerolineaceae bacterium]